MGDIPLMTMNGTFVVNGTSASSSRRCIVRSGVFFDHDKARPIRPANCCSPRASFPIRFLARYRIDAKDIVFARIDAAARFAVTSLMFALGLDGETILSTFYKKISYKPRQGRLARAVRRTGSRLQHHHDLIDADSGKVCARSRQEAHRARCASDAGKGPQGAAAVG